MESKRNTKWFTLSFNNCYNNIDDRSCSGHPILVVLGTLYGATEYKLQILQIQLQYLHKQCFIGSLCEKNIFISQT